MSNILIFLFSFLCQKVIGNLKNSKIIRLVTILHVLLPPFNEIAKQLSYLSALYNFYAASEVDEASLHKA